MSTIGWIFMLGAWTFFIALITYCYYRILFGGNNQIGE